jgi:beta-galactosidase
MQRRDFLKATGTLIAASTLPATAAFGASPRQKGARFCPSIAIWRYHPSKVEGAHLANFNDASFESVVVPHTNVRLPWHSFDDKTYEFVSTSRRRFRYPADEKGKRVFVDFEGAMTASTV